MMVELISSFGVALTYLIGGAMMFAIATYLHIYYSANSRKISHDGKRGSRFFRDLSFVFFAPMYFGVVWMLCGATEIIGHGYLYLPYVPIITIIGIYTSTLTLIWFVRATNRE